VVAIDAAKAVAGGPGALVYRYSFFRRFNWCAGPVKKKSAGRIRCFSRPTGLGVRKSWDFVGAGYEGPIAGWQARERLTAQDFGGLILIAFEARALTAI